MNEVKKVKCPDCEGKGHYETEVKGEVYHVDCSLCQGTGKVHRSATYTGNRKG